MFKREDYWPYMFGVFILGGLIALPAIYSNFIEVPLERLLAGCMMGCMLFAFAHTRDGNFSFGRLVGGVVVIMLLMLRFAGESDGKGGVIPGGLLGFAVMGACGWVGIGLGRATGIAKGLKKADENVMVLHSRSSNGGEERERTTMEPKEFTDAMYRALLERTHEAWTSKRPPFDTLRSPLLDQLHKNGTVESLMQAFSSSKQGIAFAFETEPPEDGEFLIQASISQDRLSMLLTNRYFYYFGLDRSLLATRYEAGKVALNDIEECVLDDERIFPKAFLELPTRTIHLKGFDSTALLELLREMLKPTAIS